MIILVGSKRNGNSKKLADIIKEEADKKRIYSKIITPGDECIRICTGCMDCDKNGVCDFNDDMAKDIDEIRNDDVLVIISPVRWNMISGDLKIFIDRLNPMYSKRELEGKKLIGITIAGDESNGKVIEELEHFANSAGLDFVIKKEFTKCLKPCDILSKPSEIQNLCEEILNLY